jgi:hypothetical protein
MFSPDFKMEPATNLKLTPRNAAVIAANEEDTILSDDGRILCRQYSYNENAEP